MPDTNPTPVDLDAIIEILDRNNNVRDWPEDERDLHRNGDWSSFTERHAAVMRLRAEKIVELLRFARAAIPGPDSERFRELEAENRRLREHIDLYVERLD